MMEIPPIPGIISGILMLAVSSFALTLSVEGIGHRLKMNDSLAGVIISPLFTSLPELIIVIEAIIIVGSGPGSEIAAGTIIGEPFMVSSIGIPAAAVILLSRKGKIEMLDSSLSKISILLGLIFPVMLIPHFVNSVSARIFTSAVLVAIYFAFVLLWRGEGESSATLISNRYLALLTAAGVVLLLAGSTVLVESINRFSGLYGVSRELMSILLIPVGTIMPEVMNSLIWAVRSKTNLAIGALLGEELLFTTIYPAIGIAASTWIITREGMVAVFLFSIFSILIGVALTKAKGSVSPFVLYIVSFLSFVIYLLIYW